MKLLLQAPICASEVQSGFLSVIDKVCLQAGLLCLQGRPNPFPNKEAPMKGRHWLTLAGLALTLVAVQQPALAKNGDAGGGEIREDRRNLRHDRRDIREDRRDIREDRRDLQGDRQDLRQDVQSGASPGQIAQDRRDIRQDRQDLRKDHLNLRHDRRDRHGDRRDLRHDMAGRRGHTR